MAPGALAILGGLTLASIRRFPKPRYLLFFLAAGFGTSIGLFALARYFPLSLFFLFFAGGFQTTFLSSIATSLQMYSDETNRGRIMSLFGLINRGLGPMGSFPFGFGCCRDRCALDGGDLRRSYGQPYRRGRLLTFFLA